MQGNLLADCNFSKNAALSQVFFQKSLTYLRTHLFSKMSAMTAPVKVIAVLQQYENVNGLFKKKFLFQHLHKFTNIS